MKSKLKTVFLICLAGLLLVSGCAPKKPISDPESTSSQVETSSSSSQAESDEPPSQENNTSNTVDGFAKSYLTNEWIPEDIVNSRPIAVIIPNESHAIPHYSLSKASILYEAKVEGSMSRLMAIYDDWKELPKIGNIRSLRSYFAYWAFEWDAIIVHYGGPYFIYDLLAKDGTETVDGANDSNAFFRTLDRDAPHNAYTSGPKLLSAIQKKGYSLAYRGYTEKQHFQFTDTNDPNTLSQYADAAQDATWVDMTAAFPLTRCYFQYNESDGYYYRYQYPSGGVDGPHMDGQNDEQLKFSNILVQRIIQEVINDDGYLAMQCHDTTRDGWFFTRGRGIHVTWKKVSDYGATKFYDDNGKEITLNTGKTMILVIRDSDTFTFR